MQNTEDIKVRIKKEIDFIEKQSDFVATKMIDLQTSTITQGRNLLKDVVVLSATIVGFIIPILLTKTDVNRNLLLVSTVLFMIVIIYGILLILLVLKKELNNFPKVLNETLEKLNKDKLAMETALNNPTQNSLENAFKELSERHKPEDKKEKIWKKILNHDTGFYGLFFFAIIILSTAILSKDLLRIFKFLLK